MKAVVMIKKENISIDVEVSHKITQLMDSGYCRTERNEVKQNMVFLLNLYDVGFSVEFRLGYYILSLLGVSVK